MKTFISAFFCLAFILSNYILDLYCQAEKPGSSVPQSETGTVFINVAVCDPQNRYVKDLEKKHFQIFEDNKEQEITHFSQKAEPMSIGIVLDISKSMKDYVNTGGIAKAINIISENNDGRDDCFLIAFHRKAILMTDLKQQISFLMDENIFLESGNSTALYDAIYWGLSHINESMKNVKVLILVTDGEDNSSSYSASAVMEAAKESDIQVYCIGVPREAGTNYRLLREMVDSTGGRSFFPTNSGTIGYYIDLVCSELQNRYVLGYRPTNQSHDGKWRRIKVRLLDLPEKMPKLKVTARGGYYAPRY